MADPLWEQIERNDRAFQEQLPSLIATQRGKFALMQDGQIIEFFDTARDAYVTGQRLFEQDKLFSVQEVTEVPVDLGFFPMPALSGHFDPGIGALINIGVLPPGLLTPTTAQTTPITTFPALLDTGASTTCISPHAVQIVRLQPMGMRPMVSATQTVPVPIYLADLVLPFGTAGFILSGAQVMEFSPTGGSPFQMLIGRDIIGRGILTLSFDGHFTFAL